jgi:hypothetical protein
MDLDPSGPKTCGSSGSGSPTLDRIYGNPISEYKKMTPINSVKLPVNILVDRIWEVVVDDLLDVVDVESSGRHRRRHQDGFPLSLKVLQGLFSLPLVSAQ